MNDFMFPNAGQSILDYSFQPSNTWQSFSMALPVTPSQPIAGTSQPSWFDKMVGYNDKKTGIQHMGWGMPALGALSSLGNMWLGMRQLDLAKQSLAEQKRQFDMNWGAQKKNYNNQLADRQYRRALGDPGAEDVASYMAKWGIK